MRKVSVVVVILAALLAAGCSTGPSDEAIATDIKARMFSDPQLKMANVQVTSKDGEVTLTGEVPSDAARYNAFKLASDTKGVVKVHDMMTVQVAQAEPPAPAPPEPKPAPVRKALPDFAQYIRDNPNMCWRNVALVDGDRPETVFNVSYDQGDEAGLMIVQIAGTSLPVAGPGQTPAQVAFNCSSPGPQPLMLLNPTPITGPNPSYGLNTYVPANFQAPVTVSFWNNGNLPIDDNFNLDFQWFFVPAATPNHLFLREGGYTDPPARFGISDQMMYEVRENMLARNLWAGTEPIHVIRVGGFTIRKSKLSK